jgi:hypothetical protein
MIRITFKKGTSRDHLQFQQKNWDLSCSLLAVTMLRCILFVSLSMTNYEEIILQMWILLCAHLVLAAQAKCWQHYSSTICPISSFGVYYLMTLSTVKTILQGDSRLITVADNSLGLCHQNIHTNKGQMLHYYRVMAAWHLEQTMRITDKIQNKIISKQTAWQIKHHDVM